MTQRADAVPVTIRKAEPRDVKALMRLKRLLAGGEDALHALNASEADWLRDGFGPDAGFTAFVAERGADGGSSNVGNVVGMATCSRRVVTGWNGPVVFLQDLVVEPEYRARGIARQLVAQVAALARDIGSPIVELTVRAGNPAQLFYVSAGFQPLPECLTFVLSGPALARLADSSDETLALTG
ncbi:MAG TPA: GNAT family N-acetyltransferase [Xanthobacteraceae bacterium]|nr:GNAT family N-acetyltransferase [Xanthobacteraceae bacterium]